MAFKNRDMSVIAYANGFTLWHYKTTEDNIPQITVLDKYFSKIYTLMNVGDIIIVNAKDETCFLVVWDVNEQVVRTRRM